MKIYGTVLRLNDEMKILEQIITGLNNNDSTMAQNKMMRIIQLMIDRLIRELYRESDIESNKLFIDTMVSIIEPRLYESYERDTIIIGVTRILEYMASICHRALTYSSSIEIYTYHSLDSFEITYTTTADVDTESWKNHGVNLSL